MCLEKREHRRKNKIGCAWNRGNLCESVRGEYECVNEYSDITHEPV